MIDKEQFDFAIFISLTTIFINRFIDMFEFLTETPLTAMGSKGVIKTLIIGVIMVCWLFVFYKLFKSFSEKKRANPIQSNAQSTTQEPSRPKAWQWLKTWHFIGFYSESYEQWKRDAEAFFRYDFFESETPINTPLEWTKNTLSDSYKTTAGNNQQYVVLLVTTLLSGSAGLIVRSQTSVLNNTSLIVFVALIIVFFIFVSIRKQFKTDVNDAKMTVVLEHCCSEPGCKDKHFPSK